MNKWHRKQAGREALGEPDTVSGSILGESDEKLLEMVVLFLGHMEEERELYFELMPAQCSQQARPDRCGAHLHGGVFQKGSLPKLRESRASHTVMIHHNLTKDAI